MNYKLVAAIGVGLTVGLYIGLHGGIYIGTQSLIETACERMVDGACTYIEGPHWLAEVNGEEPAVWTVPWKLGGPKEPAHD